MSYYVIPELLEDRELRARLRLFRDALGLDYRAQALSWERESVPADWSCVAGWHATASASGGIQAEDADAVARAAEAFETQARQAPQLRGYLEHHLPFYRRLREFSLKTAR